MERERRSESGGKGERREVGGECDYETTTELTRTTVGARVAKIAGRGWKDEVKIEQSDLPVASHRTSEYLPAHVWHNHERMV